MVSTACTAVRSRFEYKHLADYKVLREALVERDFQCAPQAQTRDKLASANLKHVWAYAKILELSVDLSCLIGVD